MRKFGDPTKDDGLRHGVGWVYDDETPRWVLNCGQEGGGATCKLLKLVSNPEATRYAHAKNGKRTAAVDPGRFATTSGIARSLMKEWFLRPRGSSTGLTP